MYMLTNIGMNDMTKIFLIIFIFVVIITLILVISSIDFKKNKKVKHTIDFDDLKKEVNQIKESKQVSNVDTINDFKEKINEEVKEKPKANLDDILNKLEEDLISEKSTAHSFEELQEEKAIISYKELLKVAGKLKEENEEYNDEIENTRSYKFPELKEITKIENEIKENKSNESFREEIYEQPKKFKSSDIISPIYGKVKVEENTEESEFLKKLKNLRSNLK